jgi:thiamine transport system permease protein
VGLARPHPGDLLALAILALVLGGFGALAFTGGERPTLIAIGPYLWRVLLFSATQAILSTVLSLVIGSALALALARRRFRGRRAVLAVLGITMVMPTIVVVFAILAVYGRAGYVSEALAFAGVPISFSIFGYPGILLAHVFLNAPFCARMMLDGLAEVPSEQWRLARMLGFGPAQVFRHLDWPAMRLQLPGLAGLLFLLHFKSFAIVLTLGGGPARATLEVAIYEALRTDLDFGRAAWLALIQTAICLAFTLLMAWAVVRPPVTHTTRGAPASRPDSDDPRLRLWDLAVLVVCALFLAPPIVAILSGAADVAEILDRDLARAFLTSLGIASAAALIGCLSALALAGAARRYRLERKMPRLSAAYDALPTVLLAIPPFAMTAGLFLLIRRVADPSAAGFILLPLMNGLAALPFAYRFIAPPLAMAGDRYDRLAQSLGLSGLNRLRIMDWPLVKRPLGAGIAVTMALSFGDFGIIALFGGGELRTLPYLLYERLGAYRLEEAAAVGLVIVASSFMLAYFSSRFSHADD